MSERVAGLLFKIRADTTALREGMKQSQKAVNSLQKSMNMLKGALIASFSVYTLRRIGEFGIEMIKLGGEVAGVREAFERLNQPNLLIDLRKATRGTVQDLKLMQYAVRAENFQIPLSQLATYFEFATKRAAQTGESVDYLVESIITGIGRKSVLVMDNLGISAIRLQEETQKLGDFGLAAGKIITEELKKMGDVAETSAQKISAISAAWQNVKTSFASETDQHTIKLALDGIANVLNEIADEKLWRDVIKGFTNFAIHSLPLIGKVYTALMNVRTLIGGKTEAVAPGKKAVIGGGTISRPDLTYIPRTASQLLPEGGKITPISIPKISGITQMPKITTEDLMFYLKEELPKTAAAYEASFQRINESTKSFKTCFQDATVSIQTNAVDMSNAIREAFSEIANIIGTAIESAFAGESIEQIGKDALTAMGKFMKQMGAMMLAYGLAVQAFRKALLNPNALIAAGAAMIAIGSVISGLAQRGVAGAGGSTGYIRGGGGQNNSTVFIQTESVMKGNDIYFTNKKFGRYHNNVT